MEHCNSCYRQIINDEQHIVAIPRHNDIIHYHFHDFCILSYIYRKYKDGDEKWARNHRFIKNNGLEILINK